MTCSHCPCPDTCPQHAAHCAWMTAEPPDPVHVRAICRDRRPSLPTQLGTALGAGARMVGAMMAGAAVRVLDEEYARRLAICHGCEFYDAQADRCEVCGCVAAWKARLATEHCPLSEPRW